MKPVTYPRHLDRLVYRCVGVFLLGVTVAMMFLILYAIVSGEIVAAIMAAVAVSPFLYIVSSVIPGCFMEFTFSQGGVDVTLFGKTYWHLPAEEIGLLFRFLGAGKTRYYLVAIYPGTLSDAAHAREEALLSSWVTREMVPFMKRRPDWEREFAQDYFRKKSRWGFFHAVNREFLTVEVDEALFSRLKMLYPHADAMEQREVSRYAYSSGNERIFGERELMDLSEEGITFTKDGKPVGFLPAEEIKTICFASGLIQGEYYIVASPMTAAEMASIQEGTASPERLTLIADLPNRDELLACDYVRLKFLFPSAEKKQLCYFSYSPQRLARCRVLYPNAKFILDMPFLRDALAYAPEWKYEQ